MAELRFAWDPDKAKANAKKHRVSFDEARTVFSDEKALLLDDPDHSDTEDRFILLGLSAALRILVIVHAYQDKAGQIRLISARKATPTERASYNEGTRR